MTKEDSTGLHFKMEDLKTDGQKMEFSNEFNCFHQGHLQGLYALTERVHHFDAKISAQMSIGFGRQGHSYDHSKKVPAPTGGLPYEMTLASLPN